jgi:hypothetical protein
MDGHCVDYGPPDQAFCGTPDAYTCCEVGEQCADGRCGECPNRRQCPGECLERRSRSRVGTEWLWQDTRSWICGGKSAP